MPIQIDGKTPDTIRVGRDDGTLATVGEARVWDGQWRTIYISMDTVVITDDGSTNGARDQFRAALTDYGMNYATVTELPFRLDTSQATDLRTMFYGCSELTYVPDMDTSNVTDMRNMFQNCSALTSAPDMDTSNVTDMRTMFHGCSALTYVPDMDTSNVTNMRYMFQNCSALTDGNVRLIGKHPSANTVGMINGSGLTREPFYDTAGNPIRSVTIEGESPNYHSSTWRTSTLEGDTEIVDTILTRGITFIVPVVCDKDLYPGSKTSIGAGTVLAAGTTYTPDDTGTFTFTEVVY